MGYPNKVVIATPFLAALHVSFVVVAGVAGTHTGCKSLHEQIVTVSAVVTRRMWLNSFSPLSSIRPLLWRGGNRAVKFLILKSGSALQQGSEQVLLHLHTSAFGH